ncbi:MAG: hypothetical protein Q6370_003015 [Candidatus Sigynarchaeota archaeon]
MDPAEAFMERSRIKINLGIMLEAHRDTFSDKEPRPSFVLNNQAAESLWNLAAGHLARYVESVLRVEPRLHVTSDPLNIPYAEINLFLNAMQRSIEADPVFRDVMGKMRSFFGGIIDMGEPSSGMMPDTVRGAVMSWRQVAVKMREVGVDTGNLFSEIEQFIDGRQKEMYEQMRYVPAILLIIKDARSTIEELMLYLQHAKKQGQIKDIDNLMDRVACFNSLLESLIQRRKLDKQDFFKAKAFSADLANGLLSRL